MSIRIGNTIIAGNSQSGYIQQPASGTVSVNPRGIVRTIAGEFYGLLSTTSVDIDSTTDFNVTSVWSSLGTASFTGLTDTPSSYAGDHPGDLVVINSAGDGLDFVPNVPGRTAVAGSSDVFTWGALNRSGDSQVLEVDLVGQGDDFFHLLGGGTGQISTTTLQTYTLRGSGASSGLTPLVIPIGTRIVHATNSITFRFPTVAAANLAATFFVSAGAFVADRDFVALEIQAGANITITQDGDNAVINGVENTPTTIPLHDPLAAYPILDTPVRAASGNLFVNRVAIPAATFGTTVD